MALPLEMKLLHMISEILISCKEKGLHYSNEFLHSTEGDGERERERQRKAKITVTVTEIFVAPKEKQHQPLHYRQSFPQEFYAVKFELRECKNTLYPHHCQNKNHGFSSWFQFPFFSWFPRKTWFWFWEKWSIFWFQFLPKRRGWGIFRLP